MPLGGVEERHHGEARDILTRGGLAKKGQHQTNARIQLVPSEGYNSLAVCGPRDQCKIIMRTLNSQKTLGGCVWKAIRSLLVQLHRFQSPKSNVIGLQIAFYDREPIPSSQLRSRVNYF